MLTSLGAGRSYVLMDFSTSFMFNIQTERNGAEYCYDGYDSNGQNVAVQIKGQLISTDENSTYWNYNNDSGATNPPPPEIWCVVMHNQRAIARKSARWCCRDTYFLASVNGLPCFGCHSPPNRRIVKSPNSQEV